MPEDEFLSPLCRSDCLSYLPTLPPELQAKLVLCAEGSPTTNYGKNMRVASVFANLGPGVVDWIVIHRDDLKELGRQVNQGFWVEDLERAAEANLPLSGFCQRPGDIAYFNSRSVYWGRPRAHSVVAHWHILPKTTQCFQEAEVNTQPLLPFKYLATTVLNHEFRTAPRAFAKSLSCMLRRWLDTEQQLITTKLPRKLALAPQPFPNHAPSRFCSHCGREVFTLCYSI